MKRKKDKAYSVSRIQIGKHKSVNAMDAIGKNVDLVKVGEDDNGCFFELRDEQKNVITHTELAKAVNEALMRDSIKKLKGDLGATAAHLENNPNAAFLLIGVEEKQDGVSMLCLCSNLLDSDSTIAKFSDGIYSCYNEKVPDDDSRKLTQVLVEVIAMSLYQIVGKEKIEEWIKSSERHD